MKVFHFSGGTSSALMVILNYEPGDLVIFCDTGREHAKTYKFLNDFEAHENIPVIRIQLDGGWKGLLTKMKGIPNRYKRRCTLEMKIKTARRYLRKLGHIRYTQCIGFRYDEQYRIKDYKSHWKKVTTMFPLNADRIDTEAKDTYWKAKPYKLEVPKILSNCDACFMKGEDNVIAIYTNDIKAADKWIDDEEDPILNPNGYTYFEKHSMRELRDIAQSYIDKGKIFDLTERQPKLSCACGV